MNLANEMADTETARQWRHSLPHTVTVLPQGWAMPLGGCALGTRGTGG